MHDFDETVSDFQDRQEAKDRALKRQLLAQFGGCSIADSRKSLGQFEAEELIKIRAARIEKQAHEAAQTAYAEAAARGAGKARPPVFEAPALAPEPQAVPVVAVSASGGAGKVWTPERIAQARAYREKHGLKKTAEHYGVSQATISKHLPANKAKPPGHSAFTYRPK